MLLTKFVNPPAQEKDETTTPYPLWDPLSAKGKIVTRPPYIISFTPYTTPTPLPKRPDWNKDDWLAYFKENHPNFWFQKQLQAKQQSQHNETLANTKNQSESSEFDYANWKNWSPETWLQWSNSKEYKDKYLNVLNPYRKEQPFQTYEDLESLDYRDSQPVYLSESYAQKVVQEQVKKDQINHQPMAVPQDHRPNENLSTQNKSKLPPRTYFPRPTQSPTPDPFYIHNDHKEQGIQGISNEYLYTKYPVAKVARKVEEKKEDRQLEYSSDPIRAVNPVDLLLKTDTDESRLENNGQQPTNNNEFTIPYSNYIKNLISKSGQPVLEPVSQQQQSPVQQQQPGRTRPPIIRIGDAQTYDYSGNR